jgi:hypothetical protein
MFINELILKGLQKYKKGTQLQTLAKINSSRQVKTPDMHNKHSF